MRLREPQCDCEHERVAQRVAKLEEQRFAAMKRIGTLEAENARLREENRRLRELDFCQFAAIQSAACSAGFAKRRRLFARHGVFKGVQEVSACPILPGFPSLLPEREWQKSS